MNLISNHKLKIAGFDLSSGEHSGDLDVECCLWGDISKPVIVLMGGISASRWALDYQHNQHNKQKGWWSQVVNNDSTLNTKDYQFLTFEYFSFADRVTNPPVISSYDQAQLVHQIQRRLELPRFHAVIGSSYGGMVSLAFAEKYPDSLLNLICIAAADVNSVKSQAIRQIQRNIMSLGDQFSHDSNDQKLFVALARSLAMIGYRGEAEWEFRFQDDKPGKSLSTIESYLNHHGQQFAENFSASKYFQLSRSIDYHHVDVSRIKSNTLLIGINSDQMVPVDFMIRMEAKFKAPCKSIYIDSLYGHDGFLLEAEQLNTIFNNFLSEQTHDNFERNNRRACGY